MDEAMEEVEEEMNRCFEALKKHQAIDVNYIDFLEVDKDVQVAGEQSIEEIVKEVMGKEEGEEVEPTEKDLNKTSITPAAAVDAFNTIKTLCYLKDISEEERHAYPPGEESERQKWKIKDSQAKGIITCAMTDSQVSLILTCKTSKQIWASLTKRYEGDIKKKSIEARNNVSRLRMHKANDCWHNPKNKGNNNRREDLNKPSTSGYKPKFGNQQKQTGNSHNEKAANCLIAKNQEKSEQEWIIDSGATSHMTSCFELLKNSENKERKIILADDTQIESKAIGNVKIKTKEENLLILKDVLFVPQIKGNLLSVGKLVQDYQRIIFSKDKCTIIDFKDQVILEAPKIDDFYIINSSGSRDEEDKVLKVNWDIWHKRLCHPNENYMTIMKNKNLYTNLISYLKET
ncbi:hypothetical protein LAZ67_7001335 [Cordylochernes scorpioides]|uniref:Retrovirus-related Pol polyprotein from transposon TNT 1-94-like beta-barrel domain-containing protein n=1 Tax=Cordylochernes scorpioides TaxID=51811 RepID=A0ABY6KM98_9ARAC|nr:hypothetical protein LAZ67_7001335 [Cordylochernes scorpioides]